MRSISTNRLLAVILASGILVKIFVLIFSLFSRLKSKQFEVTQEIAGDEVQYNAWAIGILNDFSYIDLSWLAAFKPPIYPLFLSIIYLFSPQNFFLVKIIQILISALSAYILFKIGAYIFSNRVGILAALIFTFHPYTIDQCNHLQTAQLYILLSATSLYFLLKFHKMRSENKTSPMFYSGILMALGTLTRPNLILLVPVVMFWLLLNDWNIKKIFKPAFVFIFAFSLTLAPWTIRNYIKYDEFIWGTAGGGNNFFISNSHILYEALTTNDPERFRYLNYRAILIEQTNEARQKFEKEYNYSQLSPKAQEKLWYQEGFDYIENNPGEYLELIVYKVGNYLRPWLKPIAWPIEYVLLSGIINTPILIFGIGGLFLGLRSVESRNHTLLFLLYFFTGIFTHAVYSVNTRYRFFEIDVYLFIFAAHLLLTLKPKFMDFISQEQK